MIRLMQTSWKDLSGILLKNVPLWEHLMESIKNKTKWILLNLFQTATVCNKEQLLFFVDFFFNHPSEDHE